MPSKAHFLPLALLLTCAHRPAATGVTVLDSAKVDAFDGERWVYRIHAVSSVGSVVLDALRPLPVLASDSLLLGIRLRDLDSTRQLFAVTVPLGTQTLYPMPADLWPFFEDVAVSPDGRFVAYVAWVDGHPLARIRPWPGLDPVLSGPPAAGCECDVDRNHARWVTPDSFEIWVDGATEAGSGMLVRGNAGRRTIHVDTLASPPLFH